MSASSCTKEHKERPHRGCYKSTLLQVDKILLTANDESGVAGLLPQQNFSVSMPNVCVAILFAHSFVEVSNVRESRVIFSQINKLFSFCSKCLFASQVSRSSCLKKRVIIAGVLSAFAGSLCTAAISFLVTCGTFSLVATSFIFPSRSSSTDSETPCISRFKRRLRHSSFRLHALGEQFHLPSPPSQVCLHADKVLWCFFLISQPVLKFVKLI